MIGLHCLSSVFTGKLDDAPAARPGSQLGEEVGDDHAQARLYVLQRQVLWATAAVCLRQQACQAACLG